MIIRFAAIWKLKKKGRGGQNPYLIFHIFPKFSNFTHKWNFIRDPYIWLIKQWRKCYFVVQNMRKFSHSVKFYFAVQKSENRPNSNKFWKICFFWEIWIFFSKVKKKGGGATKRIIKFGRPKTKIVFKSTWPLLHSNLSTCCLLKNFSYTFSKEIFTNDVFFFLFFSFLRLL